MTRPDDNSEGGAAQSELLHQEHRSEYRLLFESSRDALVVLAPPDWKFVKANRAALELFGVASEKEFTQLAPWQISPPYQSDGRSSLVAANDRTSQVLQHGSCQFEWIHQRPNGGQFTAEVLLTRMKLANGVAILASVRDVSERQCAQSALLASETKLRTVLSSLESQVVIVDQASRIQYINHVSPGLEESEVLGSNITDWIDEADRQKVTQVMRQTLESGESAEVEYRAVGDGRAMVWYLVKFSRMQVEGQQRLLLIATDISRIKQTERLLQRSNRALRTISAGNQALVHATDEEELLWDMCQVAVEVGGYRMAWVGYAESDEGKSVRPVASCGFEQGYLESAHISWADIERGHGPTGRSIRLGKTQVSQNIMTDPVMSPWREAAKSLGYAASIALPLFDGQHCFGALTIYDEKPDAFNLEEMKLLEEMVSDLAFGIVTLRVRKAHQLHQQRLQLSMVQTVRAIADIVEMRDPYTAGHQLRVAELARAIGHQQGWADDELQGLYLAGLVHDLGKIHVPAEILSKPGRLNEIEFSLIKLHPQEGYEILKNIDFSWPIAQMVLQHHERMDGSGYPQGLKGDVILMGARILCVADVVEAMSSHRPYRPGLGKEAALQEIVRGRGTQYDPQVVDACLSLFHEQNYEFS